MTPHPNRTDWPQTKNYVVVQKSADAIDIIAQHAPAPGELDQVAKLLILDLIEFRMAGRKES